MSALPAGGNLIPASGSGRAGAASPALSRTPTQTLGGSSLHGANSAHMDQALAAAAAGMEAAIVAPAAPASPAPGSSVGTWAPDEAPGQIGERRGAGDRGVHCVTVQYLHLHQIRLFPACK
jgi:hypothetical protein